MDVIEKIKTLPVTEPWVHTPTVNHIVRMIEQEPSPLVLVRKKGDGDSTCVKVNGSGLELVVALRALVQLLSKDVAKEILLAYVLDGLAGQ